MLKYCLKYGILAGVDPKSVVCEYHRQGRCTKGHKCKYSHDLNVERKGGKIDLFTERYTPSWCLHASQLQKGEGHDLEVASMVYD